ncbi:hemolysin activator protein precursor [Yersinia mollaretii]|nr:hemolysin activator protein precursor [Yersinia mollaretii]CQJ28303.1 hemolysin activator protein precursor [Yersinia mollaretii]
MTFKMIKRMNRLREIESRHINIGCWLFYLMAIMMPPLKAFAEAVPPTNTSSDDQAACVTINNIELSHLYAFPNAANLKELASDVYGLCLGEQGLLSLLAKLQSQLVVDGYITSRVALADEHYNDGTLYLKLIPGRIEGIKHDKESTGNVYLNTLFPSQPGELVNLRDIEQGLENLQRLPSVSASMDIELNKEDLSSLIMVNRQQSRFWRANTYFDDAGSDDIGRYRTGLMLSLDNPLSLSDLLYFSANRDADNQYDKGYSNYALHYSVPYGNWLLSMTGSQGHRYQALLLADSSFQYRSRWNMLDVQLQRLLSRGDNYKTTGYVGALIRKSVSFLANNELGVQRLKTTDWQLGFEHVYYIPWATFKGSVRYQQGASWLGALPIPGKMDRAPARLLATTASLDIPFTLGAQHFQHQSVLSQQYTYSDITVLDRFSIGGRNSVRGFNESSAVVGPRGWYFKNDVSWNSPIIGQQLYFGMDYGEVSEKGPSLFLGERLAGAVVGLRGNYSSFSYDLNIGTPVVKPTQSSVNPFVFGFAVSWQY